jgi:hypothetical protein
MRRFAFGLVLLTAVVTGAARAQSPVVEGPHSSPEGAFFQGTSFPLADVGYRMDEFFVSGTATAYTSAVPLTEDGRWTVTPQATAAYKTRILAIRPVNRKKFNGTVVVEWMNVSGGVEAAPDWTAAHTELIREGYAWVGVSAQFAGIEGGGSLIGVADLPLKKINPLRYAQLAHPGDSFSYDIFSQVAQVVRATSGPKPFDDLEVKRVIAAGESQSAFRLVVYVNAIHPLSGLYDGYFIHSRGGGSAFGAPLAQAPQTPVGTPLPTFIRTDIDVPVLTLLTESDLTFLAAYPARQDDDEHNRLWEVAGTAHADTYLVVTGATDVGDDPSVVGPLIVSSPLPGVIDCDTPLNSGPQHWVVKGAIAALDKWVRSGKPPKSMPRLEVDPGPPVAILRDEHGNALGGIRTPHVDAPIATYLPEQDGSILCRLFGSTELFDAAKLAELYPSRRAFLRAYKKAVKAALKAKAIRKKDAKLMKQWAASSDIGG